MHDSEYQKKMETINTTVVEALIEIFSNIVYVYREVTLYSRRMEDFRVSAREV